MKREKIKTLAIIILVIIILLGIILFAIPKYNQAQQIKGAQIGYEQCIVDIMQQVSTCQAIPLTYNNQTINIIAVDCLQK
jgi:hypothetical protein